MAFSWSSYPSVDCKKLTHDQTRMLQQALKLLDICHCDSCSFMHCLAHSHFMDHLQLFLKKNALHKILGCPTRFGEARWTMGQNTPGPLCCKKETKTQIGRFSPSSTRNASHQETLIKEKYFFGSENANTYYFFFVHCLNFPFRKVNFT